VITAHEPKAIAKGIQEILSTPKTEFESGIQRAKHDFQWQKEAEVIRKALVRQRWLT
jgi:hypothetical protein